MSALRSGVSGWRSRVGCVARTTTRGCGRRSGSVTGPGSGRVRGAARCSQDGTRGCSTAPTGVVVLTGSGATRLAIASSPTRACAWSAASSSPRSKRGPSTARGHARSGPLIDGRVASGTLDVRVRCAVNRSTWMPVAIRATVRSGAATSGSGRASTASPARKCGRWTATPTSAAARSAGRASRAGRAAGTSTTVTTPVGCAVPSAIAATSGSGCSGTIRSCSGRQRRTSTEKA